MPYFCGSILLLEQKVYSTPCPSFYQLVLCHQPVCSKTSYQCRIGKAVRNKRSKGWGQRGLVMDPVFTKTGKCPY